MKGQRSPTSRDPVGLLGRSVLDTVRLGERGDNDTFPVVRLPLGNMFWESGETRENSFFRSRRHHSDH